MRLAPLRDKGPSKSRISQPAQIPAPTKGWYVGYNMAEAPPGTAYLLQNAFPQLDYVRIRRGSQAYATGMPSATVTTLMPWQNATNSKMFAVCNGNIYDVTNTGAVGAAMVTGLSNSAYFNYVQFQGLSASYLVAVNGINPVYQFNGTSWSTPTITAASGSFSSFSNVNIFKNRLYFVETNTLNIWYLPVNSIAGAATVFPMQGIFRNGGYIVATSSWAIDSTSGIYESFVAISSEGEVVMYDGADPSVWTLKGTYKISKPLGPRCFSKAGGDLLIMTEDGIVPMSKVQTLDQISLQNEAITQPIMPAWRSAVIARTGLVGWQIQLWPLESMGIINLPKLSAGDKTQFIVNARTGAWAQYVGWDANCFAVYQNGLYYGTSDGRVMQGEVGAADDGANYTATIFPSFTGFNDTVTHKQVRMVHPYVSSNFGQQLQVTVNVDYDITIPQAPTSIIQGNFGATWDSSVWGTAIWPNSLVTQNYWQTATGFGSVFSPVIQVTLSSTNVTPDIRLMRTDILFEEGEIIA